MRWAVTICWAGLIYNLSTEGFGSAFTELLLGQILSLFRLHVSPGTLHLLNFLARKLAHLTEYAIFAQLLYVSLLEADELQWRTRAALWSALIAGAYSLTDEFHQLFVPNRTASLADCALDTTGAILGLFVLLVVTLWIEGRGSGLGQRGEELKL
jgi:VanZ family protein